MILESISSDTWHLIGARLILASIAASLGALVAVSFKKISHTLLCILISFAAGALLSVVVLDIWPETIEMLGAGRTLVSFATGYALFYLITKFVYHVCPACSASHTEVKFKSITIAMLVALSVHSFMDGLAIYSGEVGGSKIGILIMIAVAYHKFPEGLALTLVALGSGMKRSSAFLMTFLIESITTIAGGLFGLLVVVSHNSAWTGFILGHVGGGFVFLVFHALLSEVFKHSPRNTILAALAGGLSVGLTGMLLGAF